MKRILRKLFLPVAFSTLCVAPICGCGNSSTGKKTIVVNNIEQKEESKPVVCNVKSTSNLYAEPKSGFSKIINQKATKALGEVYYLSVDSSCKVIILEEQNGWAKIQVVEPDWLSSSHIGWVKSSIIENPADVPMDNSVYEENKDYQVLYNSKIGNTNNFHIYLLNKTTDEAKLASIAQYLQKKVYAPLSCNIYLYDSMDIVPLIDKYPLKGKEYIKLADHFLYELTFDGMGVYYPYIDVQYKEYGGSKIINR